MRVLVKEGDAILSDLTFEDEEVYVGSDPECGIHLPDEQIGDKIAVIASSGNSGWHIQNLDTTHVIRLNGQPLLEQGPLSPGDTVSVADYLLEMQLAVSLEDQVVEDRRLGAEELAQIRKYPLPAGSIVKRHFEGITIIRDQLDLAADMGVAISHCRDIHDLVDVCLGLLLKTFSARMVWIGMRRQGKGELEVVGGRLPSGESCSTNAMIDLLSYRCCERGQHICVRKVRDMQDIGSAMAVPISVGHHTYGMLYVDRAPKTKRFQIPDLDLLTAFSSTVAAKLTAILQGIAHREAALSATEVSMIHEIQTRLDPKNIPGFKHFKFAAYTRSGQDMPGDVYDIMRRPDTAITALLLGHVRETGATLALSMARLQATFRVAMLHNNPPHAFARALNWLMREQKDTSIVDLMCMLIDEPSGKINYTRAGKIGAFVVDPRGEPRKIPTADGPSLGAVPGYEYISAVDQLAAGETLAVYTRGVATACNAQGERFGEMHFINLVCDGFGQPPAVTIQDLSDEMHQFLEDGKHPNDMTLVLLQRNTSH